MSHFIYKARKLNGEIYSGEKDAKDRFELYRIIRENGDEALFVSEKKQNSFLSKFSFASIFSGVGKAERINFARNLGSMLQAGLALSRALSVLEKQSKNKKLKMVINDIIENINKGNTFSDSLAQHPKVFSQLFVSMVRAGEQSGTLADSLRIIASQMESSYALERRIRGALMYPAVIFSAMIIIAILMFIYVIPTLMKTFVDLNVPLPLMTRIVLGVSTALQEKGVFILLVIALIVTVITWWSKKDLGKKVIHSFILKIPIIGPLVKEVNTARTARTLSALLSSGVDVVESVNITATVVQNVHFRKVLDLASVAIKKGDLMSKIFGQYEKYYPTFFGEMMNVGEETGKMDEMLAGVAKYYEDDIEQKTKDMSTVIEPFLMIVIGAAVGFFAVAMISPMYSLVNAV